jgi:ribonuclease HII
LILIGSDEVGWGAVAGPLYVVGVAMPSSWSFPGLRDSKKYTGKKGREQREAIFEPLLEEVRGHWELSIFQPEEIDRRGAQHCLIEAHTEVLTRLIARTPEESIDRVIVDGKNRLPRVRRAVPIPKAEDHFQAVAAASVLAKVLRDALMDDFARIYPQYGFESHAGYGVKDHLKAIRKHGLCPIHRRSYLRKVIGSS